MIDYEDDDEDDYDWESHEVEFFDHFVFGLGREAFFRLRQFFAGELGLAFGFIDKVSLAFEAAVGEPGKGIEHAEIVEGVALVRLGNYSGFISRFTSFCGAVFTSLFATGAFSNPN